MTSESTKDPSKVRYHGLDALRAWAMSLGLVLHAAWIMYPADAGAPRTDASASVVMQYVCLAIHTFRMQLFFVLAGLFACLLLRKRGVAKFLKNRGQRIVVPLVAFWAILCPIMTYQYHVAGIQSGAIQGDVTAADLTWDYFASLQYDNVLLLHLWFLYYLTLIYVIVLACRVLLRRIDSQQRVTDVVSDSFGKFLTGKFAVLGLALVFAIPLFLMDGAWGVEVNLASLVPKWRGMAAYFGFFLVGWLIYRNIERLPQITAHWRWQLGLGVLLTFGCFAYGKFVPQRGYVTWNYPSIEIEDLIHDDGVPRYEQLRRELLDSDRSSLAAALFAALPEANQAFLRENKSATDNQLNGLLQVINRTILPQSDWLAGVNTDELSDRDSEAVVSPADDPDATADKITLSNRRLIEAAFPGVIHTEDINRPYYHLQRAGYALMYSLTTWSLIFGCIGFSQHHFDRQSKFWRYFSDASYWFYLAHLPIQFAILILVGDSPWHWTVKFSVYVLGTLAVLLPSYHFLIRPSWIGWMLNGRMESVWRSDRKIQTAQDGGVTPPPVTSTPELDLRMDAPVQAEPTGNAVSEEEHFQELVELSDREREAYLADLKDPELVVRLRRLLVAHSNGESLLSAAEMESTSDTCNSMDATTIGPYKLREPIGEGGMGTVYVAEQEKPVRRKVALKVIRSDLAGKNVIARFEAERQTLALMDHPNIAKVLDAGTDTDGQPYFAMELVKGIPITQYCDENRLGAAERVRLMVDVCHAVQHAHQKGIIHRDLKPSNILVAQYDDRPVPKVIDFGVAKATHQKLTNQTLYTHFGQVIGTLEYMSPEQAVLNQLDVDTRSDVYSLGVVLYELLVGDPPLRSDQFREQPLDQILRTIREQEALRPSLWLSSQGNAAAQTAAYRSTDASSLSRTLRGDLDWIVMKALEKSRSRRYESVSQLGKDLKSYLCGAAVDARPPSVVYRMQKAWRRNRLAITSLAAIILALVLGLATATYQRNQAQISLQKAENALSFVRQYCMLLAMTGNPNDEAAALQIAENTQASPVVQKMIRSQSALFRAESSQAVRLLNEGMSIEPQHIPCQSLLGIAYATNGNLSAFLDVMSRIERMSPATPEEQAYAAYAMILDGERALDLIQPVIEAQSSPLFDVFFADIVSEASETDPAAPIPEALDRLDRVRQLVGDSPMIAHVSLKLHHAALLRCQNLDRDGLKKQANDDIEVLQKHSRFATADAHIAMFLDNFASDSSERDAAWQRVLEKRESGYFQSLPVFPLTMKTGNYAEAADLLEGNLNYGVMIRRAICLARAGREAEAEQLYERLKQQDPTRLYSHLDYIAFVGDLERLKRDSRTFLETGGSKHKLIHRAAELFADPDNTEKEESLRELIDEIPRFESLVLGRIALLRMLQAKDAADDSRQRQAYQDAAEECIDEILSRPRIHQAFYYWAKSLRELERLSDKGLVDDGKTASERGTD